MSGQWVGGKRLRKRKGRKKIWKQSLLFWLGDSNPYKACLFWWQKHKSLVALPDWYARLSIWPPDTSYCLLGFFLIKKRFRFGVLGVNQLISVLLNIKITGQQSILRLDFHFAMVLWGWEVTSHFTFRRFLGNFFSFWSMNYRSRENEWATMAI